MKSLLYDDIYINGEIDTVEDLSFGSGTTVIIEAEVSLKGCFLFCVYVSLDLKYSRVSFP